MALAFYCRSFSGNSVYGRIMKSLLQNRFHETSGVIVGLILGSLCLLLPFKQCISQSTESLRNFNRQTRVPL